MDVNMNQVNNYNTVSTLMGTDNSQTETTTDTAKTAAGSSTESGEAAVYESSKDSKKVYTPDYDKIQSMMRESDAKVSAFRSLMEKIFNKQGLTFNQSIQELKSVLSADGTKLNIEVDEEIRKKAEEEIGEDGYWGVDKTSTRIMDFAKALSGGDPSKIGILRKAVQGAFDSAEKQWGSKLPEISQKTYAEVMKRFDEWEEESKANKESTQATPIQ